MFPGNLHKVKKGGPNSNSKVHIRLILGLYMDKSAAEPTDILPQPGLSKSGESLKN